MKITRRQLRKLIRETSHEIDYALKRYQDSTYTDTYNEAEDKLTEALYLMINMFVEVNGVNDAEAKQMTMDFIRDTLGVR